MDTIQAIVGQRAEAALDGAEQSTLTSYLGSGALHVMVIADAAVAPVATAYALQVTTSEIVASIRRSPVRDLRQRMRDAFAAADAAVRQASIEQRLTHTTGAAATVAVVHAGGVVMGSVGGGRAYVWDGATLHAFLEVVPNGFVGDGMTPPLIEEFPHPPKEDTRVLLLSSETYRGVAGQIPELISRHEPQLATIRITEAARRRGCLGALASLILECQATGVPPDLPILDGPGHRQPSERPLEGQRASRPPPLVRHRNPRGGMWVALALSLAAGSVAALLSMPHPAPTTPVATTDVVRPPPPPPRPPEPDTLAEVRTDVVIAPQDTAPPVPEAEDIEIRDTFYRVNPKQAARLLRKYILKRYRKVGKRVFEELDRWVAVNANAHVIKVLREALNLHLRRRSRAWVSKTLADLAERALRSRP